MQRVHQQLKAANQAKVDAQQSLGTMKMEIDWAENKSIQQAQEEKGTSE